MSEVGAMLLARIVLPLWVTFIEWPRTLFHFWVLIWVAGHRARCPACGPAWRRSKGGGA